jgi:glycosyltransferase involved in cell wall biosynthesis
MRQLAGDAGLLVDPEDVDAIAEAMRRLALEPHDRALLEEKRRRQAEPYRARHVAEKIVELYLRLAGS